MSKSFDQILLLLNIDRSAIDDELLNTMISEYNFLFLHYDQQNVFDTIIKYQDTLQQFYIKKGGERNLKIAFKYTLYAIRYINNKIKEKELISTS